MTAKEEQQNRELYQSNEIGSSHQDMGKPNILVPLATAVYFRGVVKILHVIHQPNYLALCTAVHIIDKVNPLEYQQNKFSLQFCPAYNLPIWQLITSADFC